MSLTISGIAAFAENQSYTVTHDGTPVTCTLNANFYTWSADDALAKTSWSGRLQHEIGVHLYHCDTMFSSYILLDSDTNPTTVTVRGRADDVWKFKSIHTVYHMNQNGSIANSTALTTITDW